MSRKKNKTAVRRTDEVDEISILNRMTRLLEILVRLDLQTMKGDHTQNDMILMLDSVGCRPSEIANLLGTTSNTVNVSLSNAKRKNRRK
jgi:DNA-binding CsgD family transcriptional regulator